MSDFRDRLWLLSDRLRAALADAKALEAAGRHEIAFSAVVAVAEALQTLERLIEFLDQSDPKGRG